MFQIVLWHWKKLDCPIPVFRIIPNLFMTFCKSWSPDSSWIESGSFYQQQRCCSKLQSTAWLLKGTTKHHFRRSRSRCCSTNPWRQDQWLIRPAHEQWRSQRHQLQNFRLVMLTERRSCSQTLALQSRQICSFLDSCAIRRNRINLL